MAKTIHRAEHRQVVDRLREAREGLGMSQTDLARRLGRRQQWVSLMENGSGRLDVIEFAEVCLALNADATAVLGPVVGMLAGHDATRKKRTRKGTPV